MFEKLRAFADMGRTQGITATASIPLVGAITSNSPVTIYHIIYFTVLAIFAHMALNIYIALGDIKLDANTYVPSRNPVVSGILSKKEAISFVYIATTICVVLLIFLPYFGNILSAIMAFLCFIPSYIWLIWYGWRGKKYIFSYDFSFSVSYGFLVLFGVFTIGGMPTIYTWIFISVVILVATAFAQWENGLKDVDADRSVGVRSLAVLTKVKNNMKIHFTHPYFIYGMSLKIGFIIFCFISYSLFNNIFYLLFILIFGIPSQIYIMYRFLTKEKAIDHRKTILLDVALTGILGYTIIIGKTGIIPIFLLIAYLIIGYLIGSAFQYNCEFKFKRFSLQKQ